MRILYDVRAFFKVRSEVFGVKFKNNRSGFRKIFASFDKVSSTQFLNSKFTSKSKDITVQTHLAV